ncbi:F-box and WD-40 domain protein 7 [Pelomyxa schiedti]|nr:F-box and WD-40 domain protein 7 [Pelomyxa schiedti]
MSSVAVDATLVEDACTCWVCFEIFTTPTTLHCGHTFCRECLAQVYRKNPSCPFCRRPFSLPLPPQNDRIQSMVDQYLQSKLAAANATQNATDATANEQSLFVQLSDDVLELILNYAGPRGLCRTSRTCKRMKTVGESPYLWRDMCLERWPFCTIDRHKNWKRCYVARNNVTRGWEGGRAGDFEVTTFRGHTNYITCFQFYRSLLVSGSADTTLRIWRSTDPDNSRVLAGHTGPISCVQFNEIMVGSGGGGADTTVRLWDITTATQLAVLNHTRPVHSLRFDGQTFISGGSDGTAKLWDSRTNTCSRTINTGTMAVHTIHLDEHDIYTGSAHGVRIWDTRNNYIARQTLSTPATCFQVVRKDVVTGGSDGYVRVWNGLNGVCSGQMRHGATVHALQADAEHIVSAGADNTAKVWSFGMQVLQHTLADHRGPVHSVQFDDRKVVTCGADNAIKVWNMATGARMYTLLGGSLQARANNPPHPQRPGVSYMQYDESRIVGSMNSLVRVYDFECASGTTSE